MPWRHARIALGSSSLLALLLASCATLTVDEEKSLGDAARRAVAKQFQFVRDPVVTSFVERLGARLAAAGESTPFRFEFRVVDDGEINAFALPAGAVYLHSGVIRATEDPAQLAGVLAHEMAHVTRRHVAQLYRRSQYTGVAAALAGVLAAVLSEDPAFVRAGSTAADIAATAYLGTFTRQAEREADRVAIETLIRAGTDPRAMVDFFEILAREHADRLRPLPFCRATRPRPSASPRLAARSLAIPPSPAGAAILRGCDASRPGSRNRQAPISSDWHVFCSIHNAEP